MRRTLSGLFVVLAILVSGCSSAGDGEMRITVATFSDFGYEALFAEYERQHSNIDVVSRVQDFDSHHKGLITALAGGHGAADVVAIEEQYMPTLRQSKEKFVDLGKFGALELRTRWTPWKWAQGVSGDFVMGLGTDMGSLAMCYRRDLFDKAGLPVEREAVGALWPTWEAFAEVADRFSARVRDAKFADSAGTVYTAIINQAEENYFAKADDSFIADKNPNVHKAFRIAGELGAKGQTAGVTTFTQPWNVAIAQARFATMTCPAWMLTLVEEAGGDAGRGKWDVTTVPGNNGNWGGSYLAVPAQGEHQREAYELAEWLTAPEQQKRLFVDAGILPSAPEAYRDPAVIGHTNPYFNNAPVGALFAASSDNIRPNYRGLRDAEVRPAFGHALGRIEDGKQSVDEAWDQAVREARGAMS